MGFAVPAEKGLLPGIKGKCPKWCTGADRAYAVSDDIGVWR